MEQPPDQRFQRQLRIDQLVVADAPRQRGNMLPLRMIHPHVQPFAALLPFRQVLDQQPGRGAAPSVRPDRDADQGRHLFGLGEIGFAGLGERIPFEWHDPLIALPGAGQVKGDRQIAALAEQRRQRRIGAQPGEPFRIVADIAAQFAAAVIAHQQVDDPALGLRLQGQLAFPVLEQRADQRGQHQGLGQQMLDRHRIVMRGKDRFQHGTQPHHPPAGIATGNGETQHLIVTGFAQGIGGAAHSWSNAQRSTDFCAWMRFSASSHTTERGPSITASVTSSPRWAGRQWRNSASPRAPAISSELT